MRLSAGVALVIILAAIAAGLFPVIAIGLGEGTDLNRLLDAYFFRVLIFTVVQASLSTLLSILLALPVARALARRQFLGRGLALRLFALPLALPAIVAILGIVEIYGRAGWLSHLTGVTFDIYGLTGILIAHVFFNMPLAARMMLVRLDQVAPESFRLSAQLGFGSGSLWRLVEWPALRSALPGIASLIFLLCAASFATVLTLGGGPQATTLEVAIYQALRFDFDPARASILGLAQLVLCVPLVALTAKAAGTMQHAPALRTQGRRFDAPSPLGRLGDGAIIAIALLFVFLPVVALVLAGIGAPFVWTAILPALLTSLILASSAALLSLILAWPLANAAARQFVAHIGALQYLGASCLHRAARRLGNRLVRPGAQIWRSAASCTLSRHRHECADVASLRARARSARRPANRRSSMTVCVPALGLSGLARFRLVDLPVLARPLGLAAALCLCHVAWRSRRHIAFRFARSRHAACLIYQPDGQLPARCRGRHGIGARIVFGRHHFAGGALAMIRLDHVRLPL